MSYQAKNPQTKRMAERDEQATRQLKLINPEDKGVDEIEQDLIAAKPRVQYSRMKAHREMAAQVLAVGGTQRLAALQAGVSKTRITRYMTEPDFRARVEELRTLMGSKIKGKIMRELDRRTGPTMIRNLEIMDLVRVLDRFQPGQGGRGMITVEGDLNVNKYEGVLAALFNTNTPGDVPDFPQYGDRRITIPGESTPVDE